MFKLKKRGLTLIELLITLGIISVVFTTIFSLFITNYKSLNKSQLEVELQSEAQKSMEKITNKVLQANKISELKDISNNSKIKDSAEVVISSISFDDKAYGFSLNNDKLIDENNNEIARNVKEIKIKPVPENSKFEDATGIKFNVKFEKGGATKEIETEVSFRNYSSEYVIGTDNGNDGDNGNNENGG
ncbi:MAG: prepilin-type N-terminal cleavage/methylation domain-containing protein, partial [Clostridiaceae bacterium]